MELVAAQMVVNLENNIRYSWQTGNIGEVYGWSDSRVDLHWLQGNGSYKQFVHNRMKYINPKTAITWNYVDTIQNPADIGSREYKIENFPKERRDGFRWLDYPND